MTLRPRNAVCVVCTDHQRSVDFYRDAFGAKIIPGEPGTCPWLRIGDLAITLLANTDRPSRLDYCEQAMALIFLQTDDIQAAYDRAVAQGAKPIEALQPDGINFIVSDPDGVIIEVMQWESDLE